MKKIFLQFLVFLVFLLISSTCVVNAQEGAFLDIHFLPYQYSDQFVKYAYTETFVITVHKPSKLTEVGSSHKNPNPVSSKEYLEALRNFINSNIKK